MAEPIDFCGLRALREAAWYTLRRLDEELITSPNQRLRIARDEIETGLEHIHNAQRNIERMKKRGTT